MTSSGQSELRAGILSASLQSPEAQTEAPSWYCARTKPKHEHIAAANVQRNLGLSIFHPRLRVNRATRRGAICVVEPLFPCYIFVRCILTESLNDLRYTPGISTVVHFGQKIPAVPDPIIEELQECFGTEEMMTVDDELRPGSEVLISEGAFVGMSAFVLRVLPARQRVQLLIDMLGRPTPVEVDRDSVVLENGTIADRVPLLAVPHCELLLV